MNDKVLLNVIIIMRIKRRVAFKAFLPDKLYDFYFQVIEIQASKTKFQDLTQQFQEIRQLHQVNLELNDIMLCYEKL